MFTVRPLGVLCESRGRPVRCPGVAAYEVTLLTPGYPTLRVCARCAGMADPLMEDYLCQKERVEYNWGVEVAHRVSPCSPTDPDILREGCEHCGIPAHI